MGVESVYRTIHGGRVCVPYHPWGSSLCTVPSMGVESVYRTIHGGRVCVPYYPWGSSLCTVPSMGVESVYRTIHGGRVCVPYHPWGSVVLLNAVRFVSLVLLFHLQIDVVALLYYRREENEVKQLDIDATLSELMSEHGIVPDK